MSSVLIGSRDVPKRSYISTAAIDDHVYTYTKTYNSATFTWTGALTAIDFTAAPYSTYNAAGVVLRETGKRLYADANPGVDRFMVGVFIVDEANTSAGDLGNMYIDPNCSVFAEFNGDKPTYIPNSDDDIAAGIQYDLGNPVYTRGNITTVNGNIVASSTADGTGSIILGGGSIGGTVNNAIAIGAAATADNQIITAGGIVAAFPIRCSTVDTTNVTTNTGSINVATIIQTAQVIKISINGVTTRNITNTTNGVPGQVIYFIITGNNASSAVDFGSGFLSQNAGAFTVGNATVSMAFVSDGTNFHELCRSGTLTV